GRGTMPGRAPPPGGAAGRGPPPDGTGEGAAACGGGAWCGTGPAPGASAPTTTASANDSSSARPWVFRFMVAPPRVEGRAPCRGAPPSPRPRFGGEGPGVRGLALV